LPPRALSAAVLFGLLGLFLGVRGTLPWWLILTLLAAGYLALASYYALRARRAEGTLRRLRSAILALVGGIERLGVSLPVRPDHLIEDLERPVMGEYLREFALWAEGASRLAIGMAILDRELRIRAHNRAFRNILRAAGRDLTGMKVTLVLRDPYLESLLGEMAQGRGGEVRLDLERPGGEILQVVALPVGTQSILVAVEEVTELRRLEKVRQEFVANVSHELRTPLTVIRGYAEMLAGREELDGRSRELAGKIVEKVDRLIELVEKTLALSRLERGEMVLEEEEFDPAQVAGEVVEELRELASGREVELEADLAGGQGVALRGSAELFAQVVKNLLDNAIRYNRPRGRAWVRLTPSPEGGLAIEVGDTGMGIPEGEQQRIFERFYRLDQARTRAEEGTGLGLSITKHTVELVGGRIELKSRVGEGSVFTVHWPGRGAGAG